MNKRSGEITLTREEANALLAQFDSLIAEVLREYTISGVGIVKFCAGSYQDFKSKLSAADKKGMPWKLTPDGNPGPKFAKVPESEARRLHILSEEYDANQQRVDMWYRELKEAKDRLAKFEVAARMIVDGYDIGLITASQAVCEKDFEVISIPAGLLRALIAEKEGR